jgi:hypothetical protein
MKVSALLCLSLAGLASCESEKPTVVKMMPVKDNYVPPNNPAPPAEVLIDLALDDFIAHTSAEFGSLNAELRDSKWSPTQPPDILFVAKSEVPDGMMWQSQMRGELRDSVKEAELDQLFLNLTVTEPPAFDLTKSTILNPRVKLIPTLPPRGPRHIDRDMGDAKAWITAYPPLVDKAAQNALVRISFGPTPHGACGTFFLSKQRGQWVVKWRVSAYYV